MRHLAFRNRLLPHDSGLPRRTGLSPNGMTTPPTVSLQDRRLEQPDNSAIGWSEFSDSASHPTS